MANKEIEALMKSFSQSLDEFSKRKQYAIAVAYLQMSVWKNITLREAFERYEWTEITPEMTRNMYDCVNGYHTINKGTCSLVSSIQLIPRRNIPADAHYNEASQEVVNIIREGLKI